MAEQASAESFENIVANLLSKGETSPCAEGRLLLKLFAEARPTDFAFLKPEDMVDRETSGFVGIPEWDAFASHVSICKDCNET